MDLGQAKGTKEGPGRAPAERTQRARQGGGVLCKFSERQICSGAPTNSKTIELSPHLSLMSFSFGKLRIWEPLQGSAVKLTLQCLCWLNGTNDTAEFWISNAIDSAEFWLSVVNGTGTTEFRPSRVNDTAEFWLSVVNDTTEFWPSSVNDTAESWC